MANVNDIIRVTAQALWLGQQIVNVYHAIVDVLPTNDAELADDLIVAVDDAHGIVASGQTDDLVYDVINVHNVTQDYLMAEEPFPSTAAGLSAQDPIPSGAAGLVTFPTIIPKTRGRKFIAGLVESYTTDGYFNGTALGVLDLYGDSLIGTQVGGNASEFRFGVVMVPSGIFRAYVSYQTSNIPAYQRRRKVGVGS